MLDLVSYNLFKENLSSTLFCTHLFCPCVLQGFALLALAIILYMSVLELIAAGAASRLFLPQERVGSRPNVVVKALSACFPSTLSVMGHPPLCLVLHLYK